MGIKVERKNVILVEPTSPNNKELLDILNESPWDWRVHNDSAIVINDPDFFTYHPNDGTEPHFAKYTKERAANGSFLYNRSCYEGYESIVNYLLKVLTIEEFMTNTIVLSLSW